MGAWPGRRLSLPNVWFPRSSGRAPGGPLQDPPPSVTHPQISTAGTRPLGCLEGSKGPASTSSHPQVVFLATGSLDDRSWQPSPAGPRLHAQAQGAHTRLPPSNPATTAELLGSRHKADLPTRSRCSLHTPAAVTTALALGSAAWGGLLSGVARGRSSSKQAAGLSATTLQGDVRRAGSSQTATWHGAASAAPPNLPRCLPLASRAGVVRAATQPSHDGHRVCRAQTAHRRPSLGQGDQEAPPQKGRNRDLAPPTHFRGNRLQMPGSP